MSVSDFITGFGTGWQLMDGFLEWREKRQTEQDDANELADRQQTGEEQAWRRAQDAFNPSSSAGTSDMPHESNIADPTHNIDQRSARQSLATGQPERPPDPMTDDNAADIMGIRTRGLQTTGDGAAANFNIDDVQNRGAIPTPPSQNPAVARAQATARERQAATRTSGSNQSALPAGYGGQREETMRQVGSWGDLDAREVESYIRQRAPAFGIDGDAAVKVARTEGLGRQTVHGQSTVPRSGSGSAGGRENSWGPFQLYLGGGLGNEFQRRTGLDPRDPNSWRQQVDFSLQEAGRLGHWYDPNRRTAGPWFGPRDAGLPHNYGFSGSRQAAIPASR